MAPFREPLRVRKQHVPKGGLFAGLSAAQNLMGKKLQKGAILMAAASSFSAIAAIKPGDLLMYQKGPLVLKPQFDASETFNDNITYRSDQLLHDFVTTLSPGLALQLGRHNFNYIDLTYFYDRLIYAENPEFDANQHHINAMLKLQKRRLTLTGYDSIDFLSSPIGGGYSSGGPNPGGEGVLIIGGRKIDRAMYYDQYRLGWSASDRTDLYVQGLHTFSDYQDDVALYDSQTLTGTLGFEYRPFAKTSFFGETYYGQTDNRKNLTLMFDYPRTDFIGFFLGVRGEFTERLKGTAKAGYEHRSYSDGGDTRDSPVVDLSLDEQLSQRTLLSLSYSRRQYESVQFVRSPYTSDSVYFSWLQQIGGDGRLKSVLRAGYSMADFEETPRTSARTDQFVNASLTISYDIKLWMRVFGSYNFEHLNSSAASIVDYDVNRITLGLQLGY